MILDALVEGLIDEAVAWKLAKHCGHQIGTAYGKRGVSYLRGKVEGFNVRASQGKPTLVLVDFMDTRLECPAAVVRQWLPQRSSEMLFRVVVREVESWLLADRSSIADYLRVSPNLVPLSPEALEDPKRSLVNLARRCRRRQLREALVPAPGLSSTVGPGYTAAVEEYVHRYWDIEAARRNAPSLDRCVHRLRAV